MSKRVAVLLVAIAAAILCVGALRLLRRGQAEQQTDRAAPPSPHPAPIIYGRETLPTLAARQPTGVTESASEPNASTSAPILIRGRVLDADGQPIPSTLVYLIKKTWSGAYSTADVPITVADSKGVYLLRAADITGCWIAAIAQGYYPAFAEPTSSADVDFRLAAGELVIVDTDERSNPDSATTHVRIDSASDAGAWLLPTPGHVADIRISGQVPRAGKFIARVASRAPIEIRAERDGYASAPNSVRLEYPYGIASFTFNRSSGLRLRITDEETKQPIRTRVRFDVISLEDGRIVNGGIFSSDFGEFALEDRLPQGVYRVRVAVSGYEPRTIPSVDLRGEGRTVEVAVELKRDHALAHYRITFPELTKEVADGRSKSWSSPYLVARMRYAGPDRPGQVAERVTGGWRSMPDVVWNATVPSYSLALHVEDEGMFLFWFSTLGKTGWALVRGGTPGQTSDVIVSLSSGTLLPTATLVDAAHGPLIGLTLSAEPPLGELPILESRETGVRFFWRPDQVPVEGNLGPYPSNVIKVRAVYTDGFLLERSYSAVVDRSSGAGEQR